MLRLTDDADETGRWCAHRRGGGIPPEHVRDGPRFHFAFGFRTTQRLARMLDSLVRVSRRVGWRADRFATDPVPARPGPPAVQETRSADTVGPVSASRTSQEGEAAYAGGGSSVPGRIGRRTRGCNSGAAS